MVDLIPEGYIDIHSHVLPGIDDGSKSYDETVMLLEGMLELGMKGCVPTPHTIPYVWDNSKEEILDCAFSFVGYSKQLPPIYSAVKLNGERLYKHARAGVKDAELEIKWREINVYSFDIIEISMPKIKFKISCTKGTYIRSIVRDFGQKLNSGAYLNSLIRTKIGEYSVENSMSIEDFQVENHEII